MVNDFVDTKMFTRKELLDIFMANKTMFGPANTVETMYKFFKHLNYLPVNRHSSRSKKCTYLIFCQPKRKCYWDINGLLDMESFPKDSIAILKVYEKNGGYILKRSWTVPLRWYKQNILVQEDNHLLDYLPQILREIEDNVHSLWTWDDDIYEIYEQVI